MRKGCVCVCEWNVAGTSVTCNIEKSVCLSTCQGWVQDDDKFVLSKCQELNKLSKTVSKLIKIC